MQEQPPLETNLVGVAGEYFVAAELTVRGHIASITLRNSRGMDILASNSDAKRTVSIQVKTNKDGSANWILNKKAESFVAENHYYVFVALGSTGERPSFYIVPSKEVSEFVSTFHQKWIAENKRDGSPRKDTSMRVFRDPDGKYKEKWELLNL